MAGRQKSMIGTVVSDKTEKTVTVVVEFTRKHLLYHKIMKRSSRFLAHDDRFGAKPGDLVRILETRPISRRKRWRVTEIIQRGEVAEIAPREIDAEYLGQPRERQPKPEAPVAAAEPTEAPVAAAEPADTPTAEPAAEAQVALAVEEEAAVDAEATAEAPESEATAEASAEAEEPEEPIEPTAEEEAPAASEEEATSEEAQEEPKEP